MTSDLKYNINKIDSELKNLFENVYITEKSNKGEFYLEINANSLFLNEYKGFKNRVNVIANITKLDASKQVIKWKYYTDPSSINTSHVIERVSHIDSIAKDIYDIAINKRLESKYFESLEEIYDVINENKTDLDISEVGNKIKEKLESLNFNFENITEYKKIDLETYEFMSSEPDSIFNVAHKNTLKYAEMFNIENSLLSIDGVDSVVFKEDCLKIKYSSK